MIRKHSLHSSPDSDKLPEDGESSGAFKRGKAVKEWLLDDDVEMFQAISSACISHELGHPVHFEVRPEWFAWAHLELPESHVLKRFTPQESYERYFMLYPEFRKAVLSGGDSVSATEREVPLDFLMNPYIRAESEIIWVSDDEEEEEEDGGEEEMNVEEGGKEDGGEEEMNVEEGGKEERANGEAESTVDRLIKFLDRLIDVSGGGHGTLLQLSKLHVGKKPPMADRRCSWLLMRLRLSSMEQRNRPRLVRGTLSSIRKELRDGKIDINFDVEAFLKPVSHQLADKEYVLACLEKSIDLLGSDSTQLAPCYLLGSNSSTDRTRELLSSFANMARGKSPSINHKTYRTLGKLKHAIETGKFIVGVVDEEGEEMGKDEDEDEGEGAGEAESTVDRLVKFIDRLIVANGDGTDCNLSNLKLNGITDRRLAWLLVRLGLSSAGRCPRIVRGSLSTIRQELLHGKIAIDFDVSDFFSPISTQIPDKEYILAILSKSIDMHGPDSARLAPRDLLRSATSGRIRRLLAPFQSSAKSMLSHKVYDTLSKLRDAIENGEIVIGEEENDGEEESGELEDPIIIEDPTIARIVKLLDPAEFDDPMELDEEVEVDLVPLMRHEDNGQFVVNALKQAVHLKGSDSNVLPGSRQLWEYGHGLKLEKLRGLLRSFLEPARLEPAPEEAPLKCNSVYGTLGELLEAVRGGLELAIDPEIDNPELMEIDGVKIVCLEENEGDSDEDSDSDPTEKEWLLTLLHCQIVKFGEETTRLPPRKELGEKNYRRMRAMLGQLAVIHGPSTRVNELLVGSVGQLRSAIESGLVEMNEQGDEDDMDQMDCSD